MRIITLDFETYFDRKYSLTKMGPIEYIRDPRFEVQLLGYTEDSGPCRVVEGPAVAEALAGLNLEDPDTAVVGHNINGFDGLILAERYGIHPVHMRDTICLARWTGISRLVGDTHKALTAFLGHGVKEAGTEISCGKHWPQDFTEEERRAFAEYCANDVLQCRKNYNALESSVSEDAIRFCELTARMACSPVLQLDAGLLSRYGQELAEAVTRSRQSLATLGFAFDTDEAFLKAVRSPVQFTAMLEALGRKAPTKVSMAKTSTARKKNPNALEIFAPALSKADLGFTAMLNDPDPRVASLVKIRLENNSSIQRTRTARMLKFADGRPMPVLLNAFKAHTSRYTAGSTEGADGLNMQNLSKRDPTQLTLRRAIRAPKGFRLIACDSSQIEARVLAWVSNETELVRAFAEGADPYADLAAKIFKVPSREIHDGAKSGNKLLKCYRNVGKTAILSAGYGVGPERFSDTLLRQGVRLDDDMDRHKLGAYMAHAMYRLSNPNIVNFWQTCGGVLRTMLEKGCGKFGGPHGSTFLYGTGELFGKASVPSVLGPNGYMLRYPNLRMQYEAGGVKPVILYDQNKGGKLVPTRIYGAALAENVCQYLAFALLMWQACNMDRAGVQIISNIHDSFLAIAPEADADAVKATMERCMSEVPDWLPGFPVACEAETGTDYTIA